MRQTALMALWRAILALLLYLALTAIILLISFSTLRVGLVVDVPWIIHVQNYLYTHSFWSVWQNDSNCVEYDHELIYVPKIGGCRFNNLEFDTTVNFDSQGRLMDRYSDAHLSGVAVLGDSFAMGWGVEDNETFSAVLQERIKRPVYNLAVSSYATARQIRRLEQSKLLNRVDTVVIQYCDNDLHENRNSQFPTNTASLTKFNRIVNSEPQVANSLEFVTHGLRFAGTLPFHEIRSRLLWQHGSLNFKHHYEPLIDTLASFPSLRTKEVIVFYALSWGRTFKNYPVGRDAQLENVRFVQLQVDRSDHFPLDGHLNAGGHKRIGTQLSSLIEPVDSI